MAVMALTSCSDPEDGLVKVTNYVTFTLNDADETNTTVLPIGSTYEEKGCVAMEGDLDVTENVVISGEVDSNTLGVYYVTYSATNVDGFSSSITRTVVVYDPTSTERNIGGTYTVAPGSYRYWLSTQAAVNFEGPTVNLTYYAPGLYYISDYMGGYYDQKAGYGSDYAMKGFVKLNNDNTLEAITADVAGWGDSADSVAGSYDEATGKISLEVAYAGQMIFYINLTK